MCFVGLGSTHRLALLSPSVAEDSRRGEMLPCLRCTKPFQSGPVLSVGTASRGGGRGGGRANSSVLSAASRLCWLLGGERRKVFLSCWLQLAWRMDVVVGRLKQIVGTGHTSAWDTVSSTESLAYWASRSGVFGTAGGYRVSVDAVLEHRPAQTHNNNTWNGMVR